jgi:predicted nucleotide-binding protein
VTVGAKSKATIMSIVNMFEEAKSSATPSHPPVEKPEEKFKIFIGHGRSHAWHELKNHLQDKHKCSVVAFESGERAGHGVRDILTEMLNESSIAFLVLTSEDETAEGDFRARQNVVHETGLFQGRLGFSRAIVLLEEGVEGFSNMCGIQHISFGKGRIKETFGDVLAVINREKQRAQKCQ